MLEGAIALAGAGNGLAVVAMGKQGAQEINYASDIDVVLVAADATEVDPSLARSVLAIASRAYRIDTNLRPEGRSGVLVRSVDSYVAYWERWARPWEFQALLKARYSAGDADCGAMFEKAAAEHLWSRRFGADELAELRTMKARAEAIIARRGLDQRELKRGRGGIQGRGVLRAAPATRPRRTRPRLFAYGPPSPRLAELADAGYVAAEDAATLAISYTLLAHRRAPSPARRGGAGAHRSGRARVEGPPGAGARVPRAGPGDSRQTVSTPSSPAIKAPEGRSTNACSSGPSWRRSPLARRDRARRRGEQHGYGGHRLRARRRRGAARRVRLR